MLIGATKQSQNVLEIASPSVRNDRERVRLRGDSKKDMLGVNKESPSGVKPPLLRLTRIPPPLARKKG